MLGLYGMWKKSGGGYPQKCSQVCTLYITSDMTYFQVFAQKESMYRVLEEREHRKMRAGRGGGENERRNLGKETREEQQEGKVEGPGVT